MKRDYEYSIEDFCQYVHNQFQYDECCRGGRRIKYVWSELGSSLQGTDWADIVWWPIVTIVTIVTTVIRLLPSAGHSADWGWVDTWAQARDRRLQH